MCKFCIKTYPICQVRGIMYVECLQKNCRSIENTIPYSVINKNIEIRTQMKTIESNLGLALKL